MVVDVRSCFIKFVLSFFVTGDPQLVQQVLQIKGITFISCLALLIKNKRVIANFDMIFVTS